MRRNTLSAKPGGLPDAEKDGVGPAVHGHALDVVAVGVQKPRG